ncbi:type II secretion system minor pseudopilin GspK [Neptunicoccus sediminis]|uniref:type II secretion system minor pseudopilin GspK n=1 Tax=Neptunicoccus sediminis TaxID=1892596 RepID=UPI000845E057|nr:type II secretion system minor pseudopilin GspK [Neptunicoccus sediminis]
MKRRIHDTADRGLALINALVLVAALSAVAVLLLQLAQGSRLRQVTTQEVTQATAYLDGLELLVISRLDADRARGPADHPGEAWAKTGGSDVPIDRGRGRYDITDLSGKFSLGWVSGGDILFGIDAYNSLLAAAGVSAELGTEIREFVSVEGPRDLQPYLQQTPPVRPRGGVEILPQLQQVSGMTPAAYARFAQLFTAVRTEGVINVNTAPVAVLAAVLAELSASEIAGLVETRRDSPFETTEALHGELARLLGEEKSEEFDFSPYGISSHWFGARISVTLGQTRLARQVVLERSGETGKTKAIFRFAEN